MRTSITLMGLALTFCSVTAMAVDNMTHHSSSSAKSSAAWSSMSSNMSSSNSSIMKGTMTKDADNTDINTRDKGGNTLTPQKQTNSESDLKVLAAVRSAIIDDENLSMAAHNVKVIVVNGTVTLRGPVKTTSEKTRIEQLARNVVGVVNIDNRLEINTK